MEKLKFSLELLNGSALILGFFLLAWLTFHLYDRWEGNWLSVVFGVAGGVSFAFYLFIEQLGTFLTRVSVYLWRINGAVEPFSPWQEIVFAIGAFTLSVGILLMIRSLSRPRFGEIPWVVACAITLLYVVIRTSIHYI